MKLATLGYIPPKTVGNSESFLSNVRQFKTKYPLVLYSDRDYGEGVIKISDPEVVKKAATPNGTVNRFAVNNALFFTGIRIAVKHDFTHIIYLESDCRVGCDYWDEKLFDEFFDQPTPCVCGGTVAVYNPCNSTLGVKRWNEFVSKNIRKNYPLATYGWKGASDDSGSCVFVNGALGVYSVDWLKVFFKELFGDGGTLKLAVESSAWDLELGKRVWELFDYRAYDLVAFLKSVYSSYGNVITTEKERQEMLISGLVCGIHQTKSDWKP